MFDIGISRSGKLIEPEQHATTKEDAIKKFDEMEEKYKNEFASAKPYQYMTYVYDKTLGVYCRIRMYSFK